MGAFETFVNANLGIRKPLILDSGPPSDSDKAAGIVGSEYIDLENNFLYEKTGENNSTDWAFTRKLGDSLGEFSSDISSDFSSGISAISQDLVNLSGELQNSLDIISKSLIFALFWTFKFLLISKSFWTSKSLLIKTLLSTSKSFSITKLLFINASLVIKLLFT